MKLQRQIAGASHLLHVSGSNAEVGPFLNMLYNFGIISEIPYVHRLEKGQVTGTAKSDRRRLLRGALAIVDAQKDSPLQMAIASGRLTRKAYTQAHKCTLRFIRAARWIQQFALVTGEEANGNKRGGSRVKLVELELEPSEREAIARLRSKIFGH